MKRIGPADAIESGSQSEGDLGYETRGITREDDARPLTDSEKAARGAAKLIHQVGMLRRSHWNPEQRAEVERQGRTMAECTQAWISGMGTKAVSTTLPKAKAEKPKRRTKQEPAHPPKEKVTGPLVPRTRGPRRRWHRVETVEYVSVVDFRAQSLNRGSLKPVMVNGEIVQARQAPGKPPKPPAANEEAGTRE